MEPNNINTPNHEPIDRRTEFQKVWDLIRDIVIEIVDLKKGVNKLETIQEIKGKKSMSGANAWMLMCSIIIASIGLDVESPAVIIGAMLISPLMSPILGIGLGFGINDQDILRNSLSHFVVAMIIAVLMSTIYFYLTPLGEMTSEIEARTEPTMLDIFIALFGGLAGIISVARKDISTTLPGVAIATALMPPLCVTGFGIANGDWMIASNSFYLFFLNTFFVALATYFIIRYLRFPYTKYRNKKDKRRNLLYILLLGLIVTIPSFFIAKKVITKLRTKVNISNFITEYIGEDRIYLDEHIYVPTDSINRLVLKVYGDRINIDKIDLYQEGLKKHKIKDTELLILPTSEVDLKKLSSLEKQITGVKDISKKLEKIEQEKTKQDELILSLQKRFDNEKLDSLSMDQIKKTVKVFIPEITDIKFASGESEVVDSVQINPTYCLVDWKPNTPRRTKRSQEEKLKELLTISLRDSSVVIRSN